MKRVLVAVLGLVMLTSCAGEVARYHKDVEIKKVEACKEIKSESLRVECITNVSVKPR